jgi:hypothetical protein
MSTANERDRHGKRIQRTERAIKRQLKIAKQSSSFNGKIVKEPHRLAKHHAMDCGNTQCYVCGNPRRTHKDKLPIQEKRFYQDVDTVRETHSNGSKDQNNDETI